MKKNVCCGILEKIEFIDENEIKHSLVNTKIRIVNIDMRNKRIYKIDAVSGIDEKIYVDINGQQQYVFIRGIDVKNPIILYLHGGPANPDSFMTYEFAREICSDFTFVSWDQRGCGRTYYKNKKADSKNETATFEQALKDVDGLVDYLCDRFRKEKVIIMGHSYGSLLGIHYVNAHPEKVTCYVGIGQTVSITGTQEANYNEIVHQNLQNSQEKEKLTIAYNNFKGKMSLQNLSAFQRLTLQYYMKHLDVEKTNQLKLIFLSPDLSWNDIRWIMGMLHMKKHYVRNKKLLDYVLSADTYSAGEAFRCPVYFISGEYDKHCRVEMVQKYCETLNAPMKGMTVIEKCGHSPQIDKPKETADEVKKILLS